MEIYIDSQIKIKSPSIPIKEFIKKELEIPNPEIQKKQAMGFWCGNIPKTLKLYSKNEDTYILPIGEIDNIWKMHPVKDDYKINFGKHEKIDFPSNKITPYDYQEKAIQEMVKVKRGILESKCGSGKSIMLLEIIRRIGFKALIICEKKEILNQFKDYLINCFGMNKGDYGIISEGNVEIGKYVTIALRQTLARIDLTPYKFEFGTIATDECFSGDTEILTENGFVRFDELNKKEKVAQYNDDGSINFVNPIRYIEKNVDEYIQFTNKNICIKTTLNHNMIAKNKQNKQNKIYKIKSSDFICKKMSNYYMINTANIKNEKKQKLTAIQKIGIMIQADGALYYKGEKETEWRLDFSKKRKIEEFKKLCNEANLNYKEGKIRNFDNTKWNESISFRIKLPNKNYKIFREFLEIPKNYKYARDIINEISKWDSYITKNNVIEYDTTVYENIDFVQTVSIMCGYKCSKITEIKRKNKKHRNIFRLYIGLSENTYYLRFKKEVVKEKIKTYCVEVPTNMIVCRKDGFVFICGNCQNVGGSVTKCTQYSKILNNLASEYRYGVSATAFRTDGLTRAMHSLLNTVKYSIPEENIADKIIKANIQPVRTDFEIPDSSLKYDGTIDYTKLPSDIATDAHRNELILDLLKKNKENYNLILSDRLEGLELIFNALGEGQFINGKMTSKKAKQERQNAIEKLRNKEEHYLFATYSLAKEGLDIKSLNRLYLIAPTKNKIVLIQSVGRIERKDKNKETPIVYDFIDNDIYFEKAYKARKTIYKKNSNKILEELDVSRKK